MSTRGGYECSGRLLDPGVTEIGLMGEGDIIGRDEPILITGSTGFIGRRVVAKLLEYGFQDVRCLTRSKDALRSLLQSVQTEGAPRISAVLGDLLSAEDCRTAAKGVRLVYHLAAPIGVKSVAEAREKAGVAMSNLFDALCTEREVKRVVLVSSFAVYANAALPPGGLLDESCPVESDPAFRGDPYCCAKVVQEDVLRHRAQRDGVPYVIVRPGVVYGEGGLDVPGRVGVRKGRVLVHLGGSNVIPLTYVDNCAEAIVLAGLRPGVEAEVINVVDDGELTSREFVERYRQAVRDVWLLDVPRAISRAAFQSFELLSWLARTPSKYNRWRWSAYWGGNTYSNVKAKALLGWAPKVSLPEGLSRLFESFDKKDN